MNNAFIAKLTNDSYFYNTIFSRDDIITLNKRLADRVDFRKYIGSYILRLKPEDFERNEILLDYLCNMYRFGEARRFSFEKLSTLLSIGYYIFAKSLDNKMTNLDSYESLKKITKKHTLNRPPFSYFIFTAEEEKAFLVYMARTFYRHYSLYELAMTKFIDYNIFPREIFTNGLRLPELQSLSEGTEVDPNGVRSIVKNYLSVWAPQKEEDESKEAEGEEGEGEGGKEDGRKVPKLPIEPAARQKDEDEIFVEGAIGTTLSKFTTEAEVRIVQSKDDVIKIAEQIVAPPGKKK